MGSLLSATVEIASGGMGLVITPCRAIDARQSADRIDAPRVERFCEFKLAPPWLGLSLGEGGYPSTYDNGNMFFIVRKVSCRHVQLSAIYLKNCPFPITFS